MGQEFSIPDLIRQEATKAGVDPAFALAVAEQESGPEFNPRAIGPAIPGRTERAMGTFQLLPSTAHGLGVNPGDPLQNIQGGVRYLRQLLDQNQGDHRKTLNAYGGVVRSKSPYADEVMARIPKFVQAATDQAPTEAPAAPQQEQSWMDWGISGAKSVASSFDPRTSEGRENLASTAAGIGVGVMTEGVGLVPWIVRALAPAVAGGLMAGGEQALGTSEQTDSVGGAAISGAGRQLGYELAGRAFLWIPRKLTRAVLASSVATAAEKGLAGEYEAGLRAGAPSVGGTAEAVSKLVKGGAAMEARKIAGKEVEAAAVSGPPVAMQPVKSALKTMVDVSKPESVFPGKSKGRVIGFGLGEDDVARGLERAKEAATTATNPADRARFSRFVAEQSALKEGDERALPVSGILDRLYKAPEEISFQDAHSLKLLLDDRISWQSTAKTVDERLAKGVRVALRRELATHEPYNKAATAYQKIAPLYDPRQAGGKLIRAAWTNPDAIAKTLKADRPLAASAVKRLLVEQSAAGGDAQGGAAAWDAVRSHFTYNNLIVGGPKNLADRVQKLVVEHPEFAKTVYGDPTGAQVLSNLTHMGQAITKFSESSFHERVDPHLTHQAVDAMHAVIGLHTPGGLRAAARTLLMSPKSADFLEWVSYSPTYTKWFVRGLLGPEMTGASTALMRAWNQTNDNLIEQQRDNAQLEAP